MSVVLQVRMDSVLHQQVREQAVLEGVSVSDWVREAIKVSLGVPSKSSGGGTPSFAGKVLAITKSKVCSVCGKETEHWGYDMRNRVVCVICAAV